MKNKLLASNKIIACMLLYFILWMNVLYGNYDNNYKNLLLNYEKLVWTNSSLEINSIESKIITHIQKYPYSSFGYYLLSLLYIKKFVEDPHSLSYLNKAKELAQQSYDLNPKADFAIVAIVNYLDAIGERTQALELIEQAFNLKIEPTWRIYFSLACIKMYNAEPALVLSLFEQSLAFKITQPDIIIPYMVRFLEEIYQGKALIEQLSKYSEIYAHYLFDISKAKALAALGSFYEAHLLYEKIYVKYPLLYEYKILDAILLHEKLNDIIKAKLLLKQLLASKDIKNKLSASELETINLNLGLIFIKEKNFNEGYKYIYTVLAKSADPLNIIMHVMNVYKQQKSYKELLEFLSKIKEEVLMNGMIFALEAEIFSEYLKDYSKAINSYLNAILLEPHRSEFYNGLGIVYYKIKNIDEALNSFSKAVDLNEYDALAWYNRACILVLKNDINEALKSLQIAISLNPSLRDIAKNDKDFISINNDSRFVQIINSSSPNMSEDSINIKDNNSVTIFDSFDNLPEDLELLSH